MGPLGGNKEVKEWKSNPVVYVSMTKLYDKQRMTMVYM